MSEKVEDEEFIIRNYKTSDYEATLEILKKLQADYDIGLDEDVWRKTSGLRQFKPNLKRITLIAEDKKSGEVVGMGMIEAVKNSLGRYIGYLDNWATKQEYIGKKLGKILADYAIQVLKSWGCSSIRINLGYNKLNIIKLLKVMEKNMGFKPIVITLEKKFDEE